MSIDREQTLHVSRLARLEISDEEARVYSLQLSQVLTHFDLLDQVDTTGVIPLSHPLDITNVFAEDKMVPSFARAEMLANAPKQDGEFYLVPPVIGQS
jgi:aspartyl-tRNA(Asn)/glutamyl-tRNA(Gln) amidotransferase subunit C